MQPFLDDIRHLSARGDHESALEFIELWLAEHPGDPEARLLKAEICLAAQKNHAYIGQILNDATHDYPERFEALRQQSGELAWTLVAEGRERLRSRHPGDALDCFDQAVVLLPADAVIPLAAGLALLRINPPPPEPSAFSPFEDARRRLSPATLAAEVEKYLQLVFENAQPGERPYEVAASALIRQQIAQGKLVQESLALLASIPNPASSTRDLIAEMNERVSALVLETIANLLRIGLPDKADLLLETCARAKFASPRLALYQAERLTDQPEQAHAAYKRALRRTASAALGVGAVRTLLVAAQGIQVKCPHCGKATRPNVSTCIFCATSLIQRALLIDGYPDAPDAALAQIGMAEMLVQQGKHAQALEHWQRAADLLPGDHRALKPLRALYDRITCKEEPPADMPACLVMHAFAEKGVVADVLLQISRVNETQPDAWFVVPIQKRGILLRRLIGAGQLKVAQETLNAAFADKPERKLVANLRLRLESAIARQIEAALREAQASLADARAEDALALATKALELRQDARLYLLRGEARLSQGHDLAALDDFYAAEMNAADEAERYAARKAAALVLERRWNVSGARATLDLLDPADPDVMRARQRLNRRECGEPVVLTERVGAGVMEDTLTRRALPPYTHGYFALAVREVGFSGVNNEAWVHKLLNANYEFVRVLGALRDVMGDAIFVLRTISRPHRQIPERGSVTVALLVRVSAQDETQCRARALQLWTDIHAILPLAQENIYVFEPVVDEDELQALLLPFEPVHAAEIARREFEGEGVYAVSPFTPGTLDLHNLHWALLRQTAPAMISLHLKPTSLLPWERSTALDYAPDEPTEDYALLDPVTPSADPMNRHLARVQLWEKLQMKRVQLNNLDSAYLLRVYVAGSAGTSQLLPEMAAAALFGSTREQSGGYEIVRAGSPQAFDVIRRNLSALDVESWTPDTARLRYLVGEGEAAQVFRLPIPSAEGVPGMATLEGKPVVPPVGMPDGGARLGVSVARIKGVPLPITQAEDDRRRHLYAVGKTGMGKSTLLMTLILQDIEAGRGVFLLDPHGDLCDDVLARIPNHRADDVILLDPSDAERPVGLNILNAETEADQHRIVNEFIGLLIRLYDPHNQAIVGPIFQQNVRNAMLAAMSLPDGTLIDVYRLLSDPPYVKRVLPYIKDPLVKNYWEEIAARISSGASDHWKAELLPYLVSKFSRFVEDSTLRRMIGQPRTSIQWNKVMDEGKILLVNLAKGRIGQENSQFIGSLVLSSVLQAAFRRGEIPAARRKEFYIYIDEVQNYATPMLATMLSEGRKFGVILTIANQFLHQLDHGTREAVFGNVGSLVAFRVGTQDAPALAPEFYPVFSPGDLLNLPQFTACVKLLIDGVAARPFTMRTLPAMIPPDYVRAARIREASRQRYGTDITRVQQDILKKF